MRDSRAFLVPLCLTLAESCWAYVIVAVTGLLFGQAQSPILWPVILALLIAGGYIGWLVSGIRGDPVSLALLLGLAGMIAVYIVVAIGPFYDRTADFMWPLHLVRADYDPRPTAGVVIALVFGVLFWRRAVGIVTDPNVDESLQRSFKIGVVVLAIGVLVETASNRYLGIAPLMVLFFGASLSGLAVARLPENGIGARAGTWARVIAMSVLAVVAGGLLLGLVSGLYGAGGVGLITRGRGLAVDGFLWLIKYPLVLIVNALFAFWSWLKSLVNPNGEPISIEPLAPPTFPATDPTIGDAGSSAAQQVINLIQYPLLALLLLVVFLVLALAFRRYVNRRPKTADEDREKLELDSASIGELLLGILPKWLRKNPSQEAMWRYPEGEQGITEVFQLYFDSLSAAIKRGWQFNPAVTPYERKGDLSAFLPELRIDELTDRFNVACYGAEPTEISYLSELRESLDDANARQSGHAHEVEQLK